jgi:hypothetical protein
MKNLFNQNISEKELLDRAARNSYEVITHKKTVEDIEKHGMPCFIHFPDREIDKNSIKVLVMHFIQEEDYIACKELADEYEVLFQEKMPDMACSCKAPEYILLNDDTIQCKNCKKRMT